MQMQEGSESCDRLTSFNTEHILVVQSSLVFAVLQPQSYPKISMLGSVYGLKAGLKRIFSSPRRL